MLTEQLSKGDYISPTEIEEITNTVQSTPAYQFALMGLKGQIEKSLRSLGRPATLKAEANGLRILTDSEAAVYNPRRSDLARHQLFLSHRRNLEVDDTNLSETERQEHYRRLEVQGKYVSALQKVERQLRVEPTKRKTPGLKTAS
jgi:hypothetical protein